MFDRYYVTGGTGFLGRAVLQKLAGAGAAVRALVLPGDPLLPLLPHFSLAAPCPVSVAPLVALFSLPALSELPAPEPVLASCMVKSAFFTKPFTPSRSA